MNCKPGDIAFIIRSNDSRNIGKLVQIHEAYQGRANSWLVSSNSMLHGVFSDWPPGALVGQYDSNLKPIRDHGEDAQDETLQWLRVPSRDEVPA